MSELPRPILGTDPLRPPPPAGNGDGSAATAADPSQDPILGAYGPRPTEPEAEAAGIPVGPEEVTALLVGLFDTVAMIRGPHWHAEPEEFAMAAPPLARELSKPDTALAAWLAQHGDALLIILGLGVVVVPRAWLDWQVMKRRRELATMGEAPTDGYAEPQPLHAPRAADGPPPGGPGDGLRSADGEQDTAAIPSDPVRLASAVGAIIG